MPEAARAVIRFGLGRMKPDRIRARCTVENAASARGMEKVVAYAGTLR